MSDDTNQQIFKEEAYDLLVELENTLLELENDPGDLDLVNQAFRALHTIKGSGAMFGFDVIADFTHEVETVFDKVRAEELAVTKDLLDLTFRTRDLIQGMLDAGPEAPLPDGAQEVLDGLAKLLQGPQPVPEPEPEAGPESETVPAPREPTEAAARVEPVPIREERHYLVAVHDAHGESIEGFTSSSAWEALSNLGAVRGAKGPDAREVWELVVSGDMSESSIHDAFLFSDESYEVEVRPLRDGTQADAELAEAEARLPRKLGEMLVESGEVDPEDLRQALSEQKRIGDILVAQGKIAPERLERAVQDQEQSRRNRSNRQPEGVSSIRVTAEKLDYLVDLVGELVIVQAQISQVVGERADPQLTLLAEELERLSDELRDSTLGIRMLPIGTTFSKFRRLVRDLSDGLGKDIRLDTRGAETELDKTVIERLGDPLVHLLRNSIDHGIEPPEEREAAGKPRQGAIVLSAEHSGGEVLIRIIDDGRGMSSGMIREKAVERGLITPDADLAESDLYKLIFEPGFSTAREVTSVSGRGVGMDVVKRAIDALRGHIEISSVPNAGTTITIRLPLTLAIIEGLQVQTGDGFYVIPLSLVEECVELNRTETGEEDGQRILYLRGEIVPYIQLREWYDIPGQRPPIEQVVITGAEGSRVGIVVDRVIGEHQTVIKSLGKVYKDVEGISGATIKGDGSIALILDIPRLVRSVVAASS